jgi:hypothetical protein
MFGFGLDSIFRSLFVLLGKGVIDVLSLILGWFGQVTELNLTEPWITNIYAQILSVAALFSFMLLVPMTVIGSMRRGTGGAFAPVGRLVLGVIWFALMRVLIGILWKFSDELTGYFAPSIHDDIDNIMKAITASVSNVNEIAAILLFVIVVFFMFIAVFVIGLQFLAQHYFILVLYLFAPFIGTAAIVDRGLDSIRRFTFITVMVIMSRPLMALFIHIAAQPLQPGSGASIVNAFGGLVALLFAAFAPYKLLSLAFSGMGQVVATASRAASPDRQFATVRGMASDPIGTTRRLRDMQVARKQQVEFQKHNFATRQTMQSMEQHLGTLSRHAATQSATKVGSGATGTAAGASTTSAAAATGAVPTGIILATGAAAHKAGKDAVKSANVGINSVTNKPTQGGNDN